MTAAPKALYFWILFNVYLISLALAQDQNTFIYHGWFNESNLHLDGIAKILPNGVLQLTNTSELQMGRALYPFPFKFNISSSQSLSFSTNFAFAITGQQNFSGHGMTFFISPSMDLSGADAGPYLGLFNTSNNGQSTNHILAVELDTVPTPEFDETNGNHVGIDVNSLISNESAIATYFSDEEGKNKSLDLASGNPMQIWIDYDGAEKLFNVTLAPVGITKPKRPLLSTAIDLSQILLESMYVGFSAATATRVSDHFVLGWSFNRSGEAQNLDISKLPSLPPSGIRKENHRNIITIVLPVVAALFVFLMAISGAVYFVWQKKYEEVREDWERDYGPHRFSYKDLCKATKGFKDRQLIGEGGFGKVYKGTLSSNQQVAVKRVSHDSQQGMEQFVAEIASMRKLRHRNLVQLCGYCRRKGELLLVYDYMENGSLDKNLYSRTIPILNWFQRFWILRGVASGLLYLHEGWEQVVLHRDIKPGNILLDADLTGKLGDFGLARFHDHGSNPETTKLVGTPDYMAPELLRTRKASTSTDVYAFGVCMLEMACGRRPQEPDMPNLADWVIDCWKRGAIFDASDPRLESLYVKEQMELVLKLGLFCSHPHPDARPSMRQVMQFLDGDIMLPYITPDSPFIAAFTTSNKASSIKVSIDALLRNSSPHTMSTLDSILVEGR